MRRHWPLVLLIALQLVTIGLHFHRRHRVEIRMEAFEAVVMAAMQDAYAAGRESCRSQF